MQLQAAWVKCLAWLHSKQILTHAILDPRNFVGWIDYGSCTTYGMNKMPMGNYIRKRMSGLRWI